MFRKIIAAIISTLLITAFSMTAFAAQDYEIHTNYGPGMPLFFDGEEVLMLAPRGMGQNMSFVITTKNGSVVVIDGGITDDTEYLKKKLQEKGGHVAAWFISHPHNDHAGALNEILKSGSAGLVIDRIDYHFLPPEWAYQYEPYRAIFAEELRANIGKSGVGQIMHKGDVITIDSVRFEVMNDPYQLEHTTINNSSVVLRATAGNSRILFLGDLGEDGGNLFLAEHAGEDLHAELVQMAHHGQSGVGRNVYEAIRPSACMWCAPASIYDDTSGKFRTAEVRGWMKELGVKINFCVKNGDCMIR